MANGNGINKKELVEIVAKKLYTTKKDAKFCLEAVLDAIEEAVAKHGKVSILGFGTFEKKDYNAKVPTKVGDPKAKTKTIKTKVIKFKAGSSFKEAIKK